MAMKKKLSKEELRRAMSEAKKKHSVIKKIESPLARYNELDQLVCIICKIVVRNEAVWPVHLNSKSHKENLELTKKSVMAPPKSLPAKPASLNKRPSTFEEPQSHKKVKGILKNSNPPSSIKGSLPTDFFENSKPKENNNVATQSAVPNKNVNDNKEVVESPAEQVDESKDNKDSAQSTLPEGFFDDPVKDAKARNVEYKNPIEEEWEKFQKEMKEETAQSALIIGNDQEESATERQLDVVEEQLRNWSRVMDLVKQKELVQTVEKKQDDNDSSTDEEDFDEFLDWRSKKSYRE